MVLRKIEGHGGDRGTRGHITGQNGALKNDTEL